MSVVQILIFESIFYEISDLNFDKGEVKSSSEKFISTVDFNRLEDCILETKKSFSNNGENNVDVNVHIIDKNLRIDYFYTPEGQQEYQNFRLLVETLSKTENIFLHCSDWEDFSKTFTFSFDEIYILTTIKSFRNKYEMSGYCECFVDKNYFYLPNMQSLDDINDTKKCASPLNVYENLTSIVLSDNLTARGDPQEIDTNGILWLFDSGITHTQYCVAAGFLRKERFPQIKIPSWVLNTESFFMKGIILHRTFKLNVIDYSNTSNKQTSIKEVRLIPKKPDFGPDDHSIGKTIQELFIESAEYRYRIVFNMCEVLYYYSFFKSPGFLQIQDISAFEDPTIFDKIRDVIINQK